MLRIRSLSLTGLITLPVLSATLIAAAALGAFLPAAASAYATVALPNVYSTAPGLPDGRVYEQVSPANKNGNQAGASTDPELELQGDETRYSVASGDGNSVLFEGTGPMGETASPITLFFVASKNGSAPGWTTRSVMPRPKETVEETGGALLSTPGYIYPSADLSHAIVEPERGRFATTNSPCGFGQGGDQLYLAGPDPFVPATWLDQPEISNPLEFCANKAASGAPVGGTSNFSTVYFTFPGTLLPQDGSRAPHVQTETSESKAWGFYEDHEGVLREAGVLPGGGLDQFGAVPAVSGHGRSHGGNQVSADGSRAFFVSPDPSSCTYNGGQNDCSVDPPELYVREHGEKTLLVSRDTLLPEVGGLPAPAPDGAFQMPGTARQETEGPNGSEVFASADGSQAFFQSVDRLTAGAPEGPPGNTSPKTYDFDVSTGALTYLPGVTGQIVATGVDGSSFAFLDSSLVPAQLDLWSSGSGGGSVTPIVQLPEGGGVEPVRISSDGSAVVFMASGLPGFNDAGISEIFRYDVAGNTLGCVSCAPPGVTSGYTSSSQMQSWEASPIADPHPGLVDERGISADGSRVFFETSAALVPQDTNTRPPKFNGALLINGYTDIDVYEWENGVVYLISSGKSTHNAYFFDNSENGSDVFFATTEGLVPGDTDGGYDVYDARVPHVGDNPSPGAVPCQGAVCQGPQNVSVSLGVPASATFSGLGNPEQASAAAPAVKPKSTSKATKCRKGFVRKKSKCVKKQRAKRSKKGRK